MDGWVGGDVVVVVVMVMGGDESSDGDVVNGIINTLISHLKKRFKKY